MGREFHKEKDGVEGARPGAFLLSLVLGFGGVVLICFFTHWYEVVVLNNSGCRQVIVNALTPAVFFLILVLVLLVNPLIRLVSRSWALRGRELIVVLSLWLVAGAICDLGVMPAVLSVISDLNGPSSAYPVVERVGLRDHLRPEMFLPQDAAKEYYYGKSLDGSTRILDFPRSQLVADTDFKNLAGLAAKLLDSDDPVSVYFREQTEPAVLDSLRGLADARRELSELLVAKFNKILSGESLYDEKRFAATTLTEGTRTLIERHPAGAELLRLNRLLLVAAYSGLIKPCEPGAEPLLVPDDIADISRLARSIQEHSDPVSMHVTDLFTGEELRGIDRFFETRDSTAGVLSDALNKLVQGTCLLGTTLAAQVEISDSARMFVNRRVLAAAYSDELVPSPVSVSWAFRAADLKDPAALAGRLTAASDPVSQHILGMLDAETQAQIVKVGVDDQSGLLTALNAARTGPLLCGAERLRDVKLSANTVVRVNRLILEESYVREIARVPPSVPWELWLTPFKFWVPFVLLIVIFSASLARTVHRQWSEHELLTYPLAMVAGSLVDRRPGRVLPDIFYNRVFWIGFGVAAFIYIINGLKLYFPLMIEIPMSFAHYDLIKEFNFLGKYCGREAYALFRGFLYPSVLCIAVLLPTELSLTCWLGWILMLLGTGCYFKLTGEVITGKETGSIHYGMYVMMAICILFIGRREYINILRCAFFLGKTDDVGLRRAARACRVFIASFFALWWMFVFAGLDWFLALCLMFSLSLVVLLIARMTAETGIPWLQNFSGVVGGMPMKVLGVATLGPKGLALITILNLVVYGNTSNTIVAQETTYGKLRETDGGRLKRPGFTVILALGVCLAICACVFFALRDNYSFGSSQERARGVGRSLKGAATEISRLNVENQIDESAGCTGLAKLQNYRFDSSFWRFFVIGAAVVGLCSLMRLRFLWWPFHPLPLLFMGEWAMSRMYFSILLGWLVKVTVLRVWGGKTFTQLKPFFIGVIAGQLMIYGTWLVVNSIYHLVTEVAPPAFYGVF